MNSPLAVFERLILIVSLRIKSNVILVIFQGVIIHFVVENTQYGLFFLYLNTSSEKKKKKKIDSLRLQEQENKDGLRLAIN